MAVVHDPLEVGTAARGTVGEYPQAVHLDQAQPTQVGGEGGSLVPGVTVEGGVRPVILWSPEVVDHQTWPLPLLLQPGSGPVGRGRREEGIQMVGDEGYLSVRLEKFEGGWELWRNKSSE